MHSPPNQFQGRDTLNTLRDALAKRFWNNEPVETLMAKLSQGVDEVVIDLYDKYLKGASGIALYAVGGYGREELHPGSDIDLLVVALKPKIHQRPIELFLQSVFDLNLEVGHSVRNVKSCHAESKADITVATAMFERRFLCGDANLCPKIDKVMQNPRLWPVAKFFQAKYDEQVQRHRHYDNVEYNLEPNIKTSPGGLRDIHTALWICKRAFQTTDPNELVKLGVLTEVEKDWLVEGRRFIWWIRFGLHLVAQRKEDHLQFTHQRDLAQRLGFVDTNGQRGVERFMHHYYRHVLALTEVNDILIQHFQESILKVRRAKTTPLNQRFHIVNNYMEAIQPDLFSREPASMLEMFVLMAHRNDIAGVRSSTIRQVRDNLDLIDDSFRQNPAHNKLFIDLLKAPYTLVSQLTRMRRYGILGRYIPEYGRVIGQMQHDLFHIYTVDAHTMMVIRNMRRFRYHTSVKEFPVAYHCVHNIPKPELLYVAGLYHDIGKGRGGDHSMLGAVDARMFCQRHNISEPDTDLICWLVEKHLYMSSVSQRKDIYDPDIVHAFASEVKSTMRLDYLYTLTVADINATNPTLWNSWRATLLRHLYRETRRALRRGLELPADKAATLAAYQERALERLSSNVMPIPQEIIHTTWANLGDDFFLRHSTTQIANLTTQIVGHTHAEQPFVSIENTHGDLPGEGATQIYVYTQDQPTLFAIIAITLSQFDLTILDATINTSSHGMCFNTYTVLNASAELLSRDDDIRAKVIHRLKSAITKGAIPKPPTRKRLSRQLRELPRPTEVSIQPNDDTSSTLSILAIDRPGLMATIGLLFIELDIRLLAAKITTLGERIEDTFTIQNKHGKAIGTGEVTYTLEQSIRQRLDTALGVNNAL